MKTKLPNIESNTGRFIDGNPATGTLGTIVTAKWLNEVQERIQDYFEEFKNVLLLANMQPIEGTNNQVADAIKFYIGNLNASPTQKGLVQLANNLTTDDATKALTAAQGKILKDEIDRIEIGGRNLIKNSRLLNNTTHWNVIGGRDVRNGIAVLKSLDTSSQWCWRQTFDLPEKQYTFSAEVKPERTAFYIHLYNGKSWVNFHARNLTPGIWQKISITFVSAIRNISFINPGEGLIELQNPMLVEGNRAMTWAPAPEDLTEEALNSARQNYVAKTGDTMTGPLNINHANSYLRGKNNGVDDWFVGRVRNNDNDVALVSYQYSTGIHLKSDRVESNKPIYRGNHLVFDEGNLLPVRQIDLRSIANGQISFQDATPAQLPLGAFVGLSKKSHLNGAGNGWMMINKGWPDNSGAFACNRIGISGDRIRFQTANNLNAWGNTIELVNLSDFVYQKIGNFEIRKYPDGTMIQTCLHRNGGREYNRNINEGSDVVTLVYPLSFIEIPVVSVTPQLSHPYFDDAKGMIATNDKSKRQGSPIGEANDGMLGLSVDNNKSQCQFVYGNGNVYISEMTFHIMAIGRWK
ncbi:hypothetical protein Q7Z16_05340 [Glaesserella parasuis]|nr:hypothetical protein [Glaesserella parasuis]MDP0289935.1 hypothetical protein [Glaesserella parasuis]MDP0292018.1 hypothetical protein [Glaesserella parasuis]MDP0296280.1 hypothetical protein [Glaesserella parasuis]MDP0300519.1 hypothetical protein [Glaesserella parasuis]